MSFDIRTLAPLVRGAGLLAAAGMMLLAASDSRSGAAETAAPDYGIPQVAKINERIRAQWADYEITPSPAASDNEWARRLYLDILGRIPSVAEMNKFLSDTSPDKRARLVDRLLSDEYEVEYARNWTTLWTNILIGRNGGNERRSLTSRPGMQKYLRDSFATNKPYFNVAVNFLTMKLEEKASLATAATSRIFLGLQVQCTQCHNHPFNEWKQQKYWEMNAFFRQTVALRRFKPGTRDIDHVVLDDQDFGGEGRPQTPQEAEIYYEERNGNVLVAYPVFVDGAALPNRSGFVSDVNRRRELAKMIVASDFMPKAIVNRMWGHFLGYGFTKPVDDMGPHNAATHPELLEYLGKEFRQNEFDLKRLIKWIVLSEPYSLSSRMTSGNQSDAPLKGEPPKFSRFYLRQMRAEELYESLLVATEAHKSRGSYQEQEKAKREWLRQFVVAFGTDEGDETTTFNGSIPQALMMMNGDLVKEAIKTEKGTFLHKVANGNMPAKAKINYLFMAALGRPANAAEMGVANQLYRARGGDMSATLQDIFWAVLNSNEFILNH